MSKYEPEHSSGESKTDMYDLFLGAIALFFVMLVCFTSVLLIALLAWFLFGSSIAVFILFVAMLAVSFILAAILMQ